MKTLLTTLLTLTFLATSQAQLTFPGKDGPGKGKKIVLIAGDEEYRSEETCPMLAKILSQRHGFDCTVVFSMDPTGTYIDPNNQKSLVGLSELKDADLMIIGTRFRQLIDAEYAIIADFLNAGKPVIGFRTATHAFTGKGQTDDFRWSQFGPQILGEGWVNHHGQHKKQGARGVIEAANANHPILNSIKDVFGPSDVYGIKRVTPENATILMRAAVTETLDPSSNPIAGEKNNPMQVAAWLRDYTAPDGKGKGQAICTTLGSSVDFVSEDLRRFVVNGIYFLLKMDVPAKADVTLIDEFKTTFFTNIQEKGYYKKRNLKPADFVLGKSAATGLPGAKPAEKKPAKPAPKTAENAPHAPAEDPATATKVRPQAVAAPQDNERIIFIGNGLAERDVYFNRMETELHLRYPEQTLWVRNMGRPGDTPGFRPHPSRTSQWAFPGAEKFHPKLQQHNGKGFYSTPDQWLTFLKADTIVAFFGYNESFDGPEGVANFTAELDAFAKHSLSKAYNGKAAPRLALVSPIAFENLSATRDLPNGEKENTNLALYTAAMKDVAAKNGLTFIDLFTPSKAHYATEKTPLTINGFAPTSEGYALIGKWLADGLYGEKNHASKTDAALVHAAVVEKDYFWNSDYNLVNGVHTHGQRYNPYGPQNYPDEVQKTREMAAVRDAIIYDIARGKKSELKPDDSMTHPLPPVPTNFKPNDAKMGTTAYADGQAAIANITMAPGYKVELFASEKEFPDLKNPVQMSFDTKGRLWVAVMPTYPHYKPGDSRPDDKLIILEDTDKDGRADKQTTFASGLHLPIGFEIAPEGVYLSQEPNLCLLVDENKDDKADRMDILVHGFDSHDTHHAISAYCADASGAFYLNEGRFLHSQVETPYGPRRCNDGGVWRFDPKSFRLERYSQADYSNPWGTSFNEWQQCFISDASPGENWWGLPVSAKMPYGVEIPKVDQFVPKRSRPTSGAEFVSSRHFADEHQGQFMICNSIGFLGISMASVRDDSAGYAGDLTVDLVTSNDPNFRPVDLEFAPDGSLYFVDWHNALIGHMQHNARDPNRDHDHGRIYRVTHESRPLVEPAKIAGESIEALLENLKLPEYRSRYRTRVELRGHSADQVIPAAKAWAATLDKSDPNYELYLCEALWVTWAQNQPDMDLLKQCFAAHKPEARAAAVSVIRFAYDKIPDAETLLMRAALDASGRVRLEAIVAASWMDNAAGARIALEALKLPLDRWMGPVTEFILKYTLKDDIDALRSANQLDLTNNQIASDFLAGKFKLAEKIIAEEDKSYGPTRKLNADEAKIYATGKEVFTRDAHCATCHQPNGNGLVNIYPPLSKSDWIGDDERLIKIALKGLWGPIDVNGTHYDPTKGVPPMMGFGGLLTDEEMAAVLSYVRQSFGNDGDFVKPEKVAKVREATKSRANFYMVDEILKEHPLKK
jgi:mono/diheme cytochrome c family protein/glucose/arabinose dehydrogenase